MRRKAEGGQKGVEDMKHGLKECHFQVLTAVRKDGWNSAGYLKN